MQSHEDLFYSSSKTPEYYTPEDILCSVQFTMGAIDLDPAMPGKTDGLDIKWEGRIFLNPPYGRGVIKWFEKLRESVGLGTVTEYIVLWKCAPETRAWRILMQYTELVAFPRARIQFKTPSGKIMNRATFPSALFYYGPDKCRFMSAFSECSIWQELQAGRS
ncbi:MAG: hypothetical protein EHJ95_06160 [Methanobacteriota archaeon]|nr:MAG: hypothetical protein EHJ95_06160 [Euryarchaeota archaeon]